MRIIFVVMVLVLAACSPGGRSGRGSGGSSATPTPVTGSPDAPAPSATPVPGGRESPPPDTHTVTFAIRGSVRRTTVSYTTPDGQKRRSVVSPPWSKTFTVADGQSVDVNAHSRGAGELTCTLRVDGDLVKSATSSGDSATVDCGDSLGF